MNWRCRIGLHAWKQERAVSVYDAFPSPYDRAYETPRRECERCGTRERWLPGYGGSEIGCWTGDSSVIEAKDKHDD